MKKILASALVVFGLLLFRPGFCRAAPDDPTAFRASVKRFWDATIKQDWSALYDFTPAAARSEMTRDEFVSAAPAKDPVRYLSYELGDVEISGKYGWAEIRAAYKFGKFEWDKTRELKKWQTWEITDGRWFALPFDSDEAPSLPPSMRQAHEEAELAKRADLFWKARESQRMAEVYDFCEPAFKNGMSLDTFQGKKALRLYISHKLEWAEAADGVGRVKVKVECKLADPSLSKLEPEPLSMLEDWVKVDGTWYLKVQKTN